MVEEILEVAYVKDSKLFERDMATRRSKARADLRAETGKPRYWAVPCFLPRAWLTASVPSRLGWDDEQIEGWRIMLDRNVSHGCLNREGRPKAPINRSRCAALAVLFF